MKFHMVQHIPEFIERYGHPQNFDAATFETMHKFSVKGMFRLTNKSMEAPSQMLRHLATIETCDNICEKFEKRQKFSRNIMNVEHDDLVDNPEEDILTEPTIGSDNEDEEMRADDDNDHDALAEPFVKQSRITQEQLLDDVLSITGLTRIEEVRNFLN